MNLVIAEKQITDLLKEHQLHWVGWTFKWSKATRAFGLCAHGAKEIRISKKLAEANDWERVKRTTLHEIAHALVGVGHGHDEAWRTMCLLIGGDGKRTYSTIDTNTVQTPRRMTRTYHGYCPHCQGKVKSRSGKRKWACASCCKTFNGGKWTDEYSIIWD